MSDALKPGARVFRILRGEERAAQSKAAPLGDGDAGGRAPGQIDRLQASNTPAETIYGIPVSAVQHCCGRGCKHCRIYWHRSKD